MTTSSIATTTLTGPTPIDVACPTSDECHALFFKAGLPVTMADISIRAAAAPTTTTTTVAPTTTAAPIKDPTLKVGATKSAASVLALALASTPGVKVSSPVVTSSTTSTCAVVSKRLKGVRAGSCRVTVTGTLASGKKWSGKVNFTVIK